MPRFPRVPDSPPLPAGALYLVSTPIGNLEDITLRALRVLAEVTLVAAEDTRRTARLFSHYGIHTTTTSFHAHNEVRKGPQLLRRLARGDSVALVADAGTPLLSDPGARLVRDALAAGVKVHAVPGPSAALTGLVMSGLGGGAFTVAGFPPARSNDRKRWLESLAPEPRPLVVFEAPHRLRAALADMATVLGDSGHRDLPRDDEGARRVGHWTDNRRDEAPPRAARRVHHRRRTACRAGRGPWRHR